MHLGMYGCIHLGDLRKYTLRPDCGNHAKAALLSITDLRQYDADTT